MHTRSCRTHRPSMLLAALAALALQACASVPPESVELSVVIGERITDMQVAHEALVQEYFRISRERVEDFLDNRWMPHFLGDFVRRAGLMDSLATPSPLSEDDLERFREEMARAFQISPEKLDDAVLAVRRALGDAERGEMVLEFAEAAMVEIRAQRAQLLDPIDAQESKVLMELRAAYTELRAAQNVVTNHLRSIRDVQVEQDAVLQRLDLLRARDKAIESAVAVNDQIVSLLNQSGDAEETVNKILRVVQD
ncbi:MAG: hypothetical protein JSU87_01935 [Gemmatimonadota bacterium]|nr:MAG: hypothetical protein JSU87_01935 [Gemmatimonadota bacterium]